ncbi:MAG: hydrogenase expression/formation protein HypE [Thermoplasmatales archaeon]|nr:hydrogenase expression/formation protein HypE [Thermoplasmatales archaeon]
MHRIELSHGAGGREMAKLIEEFIVKKIKNEKAEVALQEMDDSAVFEDIVFTTDSHVVQPIFFPGGDIGRLAVAGTINDIASLGAKPLAMSLAMVIEEGFEMEKYEKILESISKTAIEGDVEIVTGDTKVVERGGIKDMIITTSAIGKETKYLEENFEFTKRNKWLLDSCLEAGDKIILTGTIADHGIAIISKREGYGFKGKVKSDVAPLYGLIEKALKVGGVVSAKDVTRGGIASALNEMAKKSRVSIHIEEEKIPIKEATLSACEMLGIDPYIVGNEGKMVIGVMEEMAEDVLEAIRKHKYGRDAEIIGEVNNGNYVILNTKVGGKRILEMPTGEIIPRIC